MNCQDVWDLLSVYADGEADAHETAIVESHIATCPDCARDLQFMQGTQEALQALPEVEPPISLRSAILAATVNKPTLTERFATAVRRGLAPAPVRYGALAAAGAAAALTAVTLRNQSSPVDYTPSSPNVVATAPAIPTPQEHAGRGPSLDLLDVYEPPTVTTESPASAGRRGRTRSLSAKPAIQIATAAVSSPAKPAQKVSKLNGDTRAKQTTAHGEETGSSAAASPVAPVTGPDPQPSPGTIVASSETPETTGAGAPAVETTERSPRIVLAASRVTLDPAQIATLADLRRSLGQHAGGTTTGMPGTTGRDRQIRVDVIRGSF